MKDGLRFVDRDTHIMEPPDLFERHLDPRGRERVKVDSATNRSPRTGARPVARP